VLPFAIVPPHFAQLPRIRRTASGFIGSSACRQLLARRSVSATGTRTGGMALTGSPATNTPAAGMSASGTPATDTPAAGMWASGTPATDTPAAGMWASGSPAATMPAGHPVRIDCMVALSKGGRQSMTSRIAPVAP
jgi:hypothetical protein